jgi:LmbE family N-acetylglucosaminyl deacetylase
MATLVCFHAHPDDETITTGGTMAKAAADGHRVVLVIATNGEHGELPDDLAAGESLVDRRRAETACSADTLGVARVVWLGYRDSGMAGWPQNDDPSSFLRADVEEAAARLAAVLAEERAEVLTTYDWHGNYGHPDHVKVHAVGNRAGELAGTPAVYEATLNRDHVLRLREEIGPREGDEAGEPPTTDDGNPLGTPEAELTTAVDVRGYVDRKRRSIECHASQVTDGQFFLSMTPDVFAKAFGTEWFIRVGSPPGIREDGLEGLSTLTH